MMTDENDVNNSWPRERVPYRMFIGLRCVDIVVMCGEKGGLWGCIDTNPSSEPGRARGGELYCVTCV